MSSLPPSIKASHSSSKRRQRTKMLQISQEEAQLLKSYLPDLYIGTLMGKLFIDLNDPLTQRLLNELPPDNQNIIHLVQIHPELREFVRPPSGRYSQQLLPQDVINYIGSFLGSSYKNPYGKKAGGVVKKFIR